MKKIAVIGGGILGLAIAYKLTQQSKKIEVTVFEKESKLGCHQSGNNSGVLHCGLNYKPNSLKAKLAVEGIREMISFCRENEVNYDQCGKIVVATNRNENHLLANLSKRGKLNGLKNLKILNKNQIKKREPYVNGINALLVPEEGIVDFNGVMKKLMENIKLCGGNVIFDTKIESLISKNKEEILLYNGQEKCFDLLINCTGLHSDRIYKKFTNKKRPVRIIPFRGEYMRFKQNYENMVNHLVYPVANPKFPFLGVHFTRMINGDREVGPNAVLALKREGYKNTDFSVLDTIDSFSYLGLHRFIRKNLLFSINEFSTSFFTSQFIKKAKKLLPDINISMLESGGAGVRAQAMDNKGNLLMDFRIEKFKNQIHVLNAPSPGATASLAIASYIIDRYIFD